MSHCAASRFHKAWALALGLGMAAVAFSQPSLAREFGLEDQPGGGTNGSSADNIPVGIVMVDQFFIDHRSKQSQRRAWGALLGNRRQCAKPSGLGGRPGFHLQSRMDLPRGNHAVHHRASGKPPSSDRLKKPPPNQEPSRAGKKTGGQKDHRGETLRGVENPDAIINHHPEGCAKLRPEPSTKASRSRDLVG